LIGEVAVYFADMAKTSAEMRAAVGIEVEWRCRRNIQRHRLRSAVTASKVPRDTAWWRWHPRVAAWLSR